jgi:hypothetical protein
VFAERCRAEFQNPPTQIWHIQARCGAARQARTHENGFTEAWLLIAITPMFSRGFFVVA